MTKVRTVRVDDALWQVVQDKATRRRETVADVIRRALVLYAQDEGEELPAVSRSVRPG